MIGAVRPLRRYARPSERIHVPGVTCPASEAPITWMLGSTDFSASYEAASRARYTVAAFRSCGQNAGLLTWLPTITSFTCGSASAQPRSVSANCERAVSSTGTAAGEDG